MNSSLPNDIAFRIASSLEVPDLCSLGSCSRFWREICGSDCLWAGLCTDRWPALGLTVDSPAPRLNNAHQPFPCGWKNFYTSKHLEIARKAAAINNFIEYRLCSEILDGNHYLRVMRDMNTMQFGFKDVELFFLKSNLHVLLNLTGLHYCISSLRMQAEDVTRALVSHRISERQVFVRWWKPGGWLYRFRLPDKCLAYRNSLKDLVLPEEQDILRMLQQGVNREVLRIQISDASTSSF